MSYQIELFDFLSRAWLPHAWCSRAFSAKLGGLAGRRPLFSFGITISSSVQPLIRLSDYWRTAMSPYVIHQLSALNFTLLEHGLRHLPSAPRAEKWNPLVMIQG
jgi:hypothetical protein